ncbi:MAG: hypothetical protein A2W61_06380 [Deltaproteobacteria bacterium RIFCSPLOWO2_01_44_7]|nr:MAG: hypothetical protein A2712_06045 [Deltaproteobacteria bacterium RIFCSPHIGHO2_01_FULL_43_49]OGQ16689.1 MAG: hypothetical protein A3D22_07170 [Deltaproteobacteria bacterium RIFCSPHIGHO2_02_FULL_44_53]OGQ29827.1 MAG: hypothetical protein A3D98_09835 [Deltaproteobacteria bacterium RIFCSPHIGHO2_12_FULL_44_21]OGQ33117.1 MAG: hypothetical protein A2979_03815 [Deltaproteobacteria bacterium RIFCSPLOWO2_01_FULL_45_74]OGQ42212.1 MAG: hypothetical protein A3I70_06120 [Deltaproteobacteria bacterium 
MTSVATPIMNYPKLFAADPAGISAYLESGLAPVAELDALLSPLEAIDGFRIASQELQRSVRAGISLSNFFVKQRELGKIIKDLGLKQAQAIVEGAGFVSLDESPESTVSQRVAERYAQLLHAQSKMGPWIAELGELTKIPSISRLGETSPTIERSAEWVAARMRKAGFQSVKVLEEKGANPSVYGEFTTIDPKKPTVIFYAHHDVQPVGDNWDTGPFTPFVKGSRIYARGIADDKAGFMAGLAAVESFFETGVEPPCNIIFFIEGEEEIGSPNLEKFLKQLPEGLKPDVVILADSENVETGVPMVTTSLRGVASFLVSVRTLMGRGLHSGFYGGPVLDANTALSMAIAKLFGEHGEVAVPGLERPLLSRTALQNLMHSPFSEESFRKATGMVPSLRLIGNTGGSVHRRRWYDYSLSALALEGLQPIADATALITGQARALVSLRIPPGADAKKAAEIFKKHAEGLDVFGAEIRVDIRAGMIEPWQGDVNHPMVARMAEALTQGYDHPAILGGIGASIGFLDIFGRRFPNTALVPIGIEDPYTNAHSANESLSVDDWCKTIYSLILFFDCLGNPS